MTAPKPCRYERTLGYRATKGEHRDDCTTPASHRGCLECLHAHCGVCGRKHLDDSHPATCPDCVGSVREDLAEIGELCRGLRRQAVDAEGLSWASARIPGAAAMVLMGPTVQLDQVRMSREYSIDHRTRDAVPPLAVLARWQEVWAGWLGVTPIPDTTPGVAQALELQATLRAGWLGLQVGDRATITRALGFLDRNLTRIAQATTGWVDGTLVASPEFPEFARDLGKLRAQLERVLHDESDDDGGIACFECGHQLVRRIRDPKRCTHKTPARRALATRLRARVDAAAWIRTLASYRLPAWPEEIAAARLPTPVEVAAARMACDRCDQGGVADPRPGISWECPGCRMSYSPGEYATAVRRDLADRQYIAQGDNVDAPSVQSYGWTDVALAADAATTLVGHPVFATTLRKWMDRSKVASCCAWAPGRFWGQRLVFWPDVADEAVAAVERSRVAAEARARRAEREAEEQAERDAEQLAAELEDAAAS